MLEDRVRIAQIKQCRRDLLKALNMAFPGELSFLDCCAVLPLVDGHYIDRDLQYMVDCGYAACTNSERNQQRRDKRYKLTNRGVDLACKINLDPAFEP